MKYITLLLEAIKQIFKYLNFKKIENAGSYKEKYRQSQADIIFLKKENAFLKEQIARMQKNRSTGNDSPARKLRNDRVKRYIKNRTKS